MKTVIIGLYWFIGLMGRVAVAGEVAWCASYSAVMTSQQLIERFRESAGVLLREVPRICRAVGEEAEDLQQRPGWRALRERYAVWAGRTGEPVFVCVIYGPTGAGKSTFFKMLTGCDVPAGGNLRPMSYVGCVAIPGALVDRDEDLATLFPENELRRLEDPDQLRDRHCAPETLYWVSYLRPAGEASGLPPVIADVPDFNSVEHANWEKAARMLDRAEAVLFLTYDEAYKNRDTVQHLEQCCRRAGYLAFVMTKSQPEVAREKWADLLDHVSTSDAFAARRHDGQTLHRFLANCPVYASPRAAADEQPSLDDVAPLREGDPPLRSLLYGLDQQRIVRAGLVQPAMEAATLARELIERAARRQARLKDRLRRVEQRTFEEAQRLATNIFPVGEFLKVFMQTVRQRQGRFQRAMSATVGWLHAVVRRWGQVLRRMLSDSEGVKPRDEAEQARLREGADHLFQLLRSAVPEEARQGGLLSERRFEAVRDQFVLHPPPQAGEGWHATVRDEANRWYEQNRVRARVLPVVLDTVTAVGAAGLALDFFVAGGIGTLTTAGLVASGSSAAGLLGRFLHHWGLEQAFNRTAESWRKQRAEELNVHLVTHFVEPLCGESWREQLEALETAPIERCRGAVEELVRVAGEADETGLGASGGGAS